MISWRQNQIDDNRKSRIGVPYLLRAGVVAVSLLTIDSFSAGPRSSKMPAGAVEARERDRTNRASDGRKPAPDCGPVTDSRSRSKSFSFFSRSGCAARRSCRRRASSAVSKSSPGSRMTRRECAAFRRDGDSLNGNARREGSRRGGNKSA